MLAVTVCSRYLIFHKSLSNFISDIIFEHNIILIYDVAFPFTKVLSDKSKEDVWVSH
jgi:hypothetical protein